MPFENEQDFAAYQGAMAEDELEQAALADRAEAEQFERDIDEISKETNFTPGKWMVGKSTVEPFELHIGSTDYPTIPVWCINNPHHKPTDEDLANARLIAAAPEMYDALKECVTCLSSIIENNQWGAIEYYIDKMKQALAKARGEQ